MPQILIVDDSYMIRNMLKYALLSGGYSHIVEASNATEGLEFAKNIQFDIVITDVNMPQMNGFDFVQKLRLMPNYAEVPLIILTTENSDEMKFKGKKAGATVWISKPFLPNQILKAIETTLKKVVK